MLTPPHQSPTHVCNAACFQAFELWMRDHGEERRVPGLDLDARQLFFVSYAQLYCSKWSRSGITDFLLRDTHSPGPYRYLLIHIHYNVCDFVFQF